MICRRLASRQANREGLGARLFVQSCVLAGSDYSINTLDGVGLINAFKLVRDNAFRDDSVRFLSILKSLPKKVKQKIDIEAYEERLAKSEAVFFYHPVLHIDRSIAPLMEPLLTQEENTDKHNFTDHFPLMSRFKDWSFLGAFGSVPAVDSRDNGNMLSPLTGSHIAVQTKIVEKHKSLQKEVSFSSSKRDFSQLSSTRSKIIHNTYKKSKSINKWPLPLEERNVNAGKFFRAKTAPRNQEKTQKKNRTGEDRKSTV